MELFHDDWTGRYFKSTVSKVERAQNDINSIINEDGWASLNDFYDRLNLQPIPMGNDFGWSRVTSVRFGSILKCKKNTMKSAISIHFHTHPKPQA